MAPMIVLVVVTLIARIFVAWKDAVRIGTAALFLFTATAHFNSMKHDLAAMIPPPLTGSLWPIYLTGALEIAGAIGLLIPRFRRAAAMCLVLLLIALFPANVYAALNGVTLRGQPATALWLRTPMQIIWIAALWWSTIRTLAPPLARVRQPVV
jgi:uncharacterized membrane protein